MKEIINFKAGRFIISFEILNILMTEKYEENASEVPSGDKTLLGVINYQQVPTPIYDLGVILEGSTAKDRNQALINSLTAKEQEQIEWVNALKESIETGKPFTETQDLNQSPFGLWTSRFNTENEDLLHILKKFEEPQKVIHELAGKLISMAHSEQKEQALVDLERAKNSTLASLTKLFSDAREVVEFSHKPVIVYTTIDGITPCLGFLVDSVDDAITISESDIKSFDNTSGIQFMGDLNLPKMISGLIIKDDINSLLIDPSMVKKPLPEEMAV